MDKIIKEQGSVVHFRKDGTIVNCPKLDEELAKMGFKHLFLTGNNVFSQKISFDDYIFMNIELDKYHIRIVDSYITLTKDISTQDYINNIQVAYTQLRLIVDRMEKESELAK